MPPPPYRSPTPSSLSGTRVEVGIPHAGLPALEVTRLRARRLPGTRWLSALAGCGRPGSRALSRGPSHAPRPSGETSLGCQTPRGTEALGAQGPRKTPPSPPGIRWDRISSESRIGRGRGSGQRPGWQLNPHTPAPSGGAGRRLVERGPRGSQSGPKTRSRKLTTPGWPPRLPEMVVSVQKLKWNSVSE